MILSCPACAARFAVADAAFANGPRKLRCAKCQYLWRGDANGPVPEPEPLPTPLNEPALSAPNNAVGESSAPPPAEILSAVAPTDVSVAHAVPTDFRASPSASANIAKRLESVASKLPRLPRRLAWSMIILLSIGLLSVLYFGRVKLATRFPLLADAYRASGLILPPAIDTLDLELTQAEKCLISSRTMLCLAGQTTNKGTMALPVPSLYITALNKDGQELADKESGTVLRWNIPAEDGKLLPGEVRRFSLTVPYPDQVVTDFDYGFIDDTP